MDAKFYHSLCNIQDLNQNPDSSSDQSRSSRSIDQLKIKSSRHQDCHQKPKQLEESEMLNKTKNIIEFGKKKSNKKKKKKLISEERPHFRIDWRQLTYSRSQRNWQSKLHWDYYANSNDNCINLNDEPKQEKIILNSLDGHFRSGQLSAILGPSGAGKSTFLSTLFGSRQDQASGQTRLTWLTNGSSGGLDDDAHDEHNEKIIRNRSLRVAFLPQQDHLLHHLTVYETLLFASRLKNKRKQISNSENSDNDIESERMFHVANVKRVARMLKLTDCLNTRCGKLSGGQYKRVTIGQELLSQPDVIILDEPTSGLDASTCLSTVRTLKSIVTGRPISIILTIHQPDSDVFSIFDRVYVIAQGGLAIYEGPPSGITPTLRQVGLEPPRKTYNAARFIVENAFINEQSDIDYLNLAEYDQDNEKQQESIADCELDPFQSDDSSSSSDEGTYFEPNNNNNNRLTNKLTRSLLSIKDTISGREMRPDALIGSKDKARSRPLLNIGGFKTLRGELIKAKKLRKDRAGSQKLNDESSEDDERALKDNLNRNHGDNGFYSTRLSMLQRLNEIQKAQYYVLNDKPPIEPPNGIDSSVKLQMEPPSLSVSGAACSRSNSTKKNESNKTSNSDSKSDYSSASSAGSDHGGTTPTTGSLKGADSTISIHLPTSSHDQHPNQKKESLLRSASESSTKRLRLCDFDKRLSAKNNHHQAPALWYQARLLAHRTWLSIVRDPIFFGIQAFMHTTIPVLLALIFGSAQQDGCPQVGNFDLIQFAYSNQAANGTVASKSIISEAVVSIRQSVGNVGIIFFEMFVLSFSINCITALVFPSDMFVLLKEYRNGWYSMSSYFIGRSLADLPIPVVLHSLAMLILCLLTKQPLEIWRLSSIILLVILSSLIAQSVGLTVGAVLMRNSQSAVLAAAGIVAPFFALSGFIVRIHTLPWAAQLFAKGSYLHQLLNGFIILRYGFERCPCKESDFEQDPSHQVPKQLHTMASIWVGTFNQEYSSNGTKLVSNSTMNEAENEDRNIDVVEKIMNSFRSASSFGHQMNSCKDVRPYAMLDFNLHDYDILWCFISILIMVVVSRLITFAAIYFKVRSST